MDDKSKELREMAAAEGVELTDEQLEGVAGGYIYHDEGSAAARRREAYYVVDNAGKVVMRLDSQAKAEHWAGNLRTNTTLLSSEEFEKIRRRNV